MKKLLTMIAAAVIGLTAMAQGSDPVIFEIGNEKIHQSEFLKEFLASIGKDPSAPKTACTYEKRQALEEYVQLFVNFRTKLADAYAEGYDTMATLRRELMQYRKDLAAPYLMDSATMNAILHEAYERDHYVVRAQHILVRCNQNAPAIDTMKAYKRAMAAYNRVMAGEDFGKVAWEEEEYSKNGGTVIDPLAKPNPYAGELGYFTVFDMIYPFENAVYSMKVGEISKPVRTRFGYHIIKLMDRQPLHGETQIQHIWIRGDVDSVGAKRKIMEAYGRLKGGESFESMVKNYSDDRTTLADDGRLPALAANRLPLEYMEKISSGMKEGEYSEPFKTRYGWHIVRLLSKTKIAPFEDMVPIYKQKLTRDQRNNNPKNKFIEEAKKKYGVVDYTQLYVLNKKGKPTKEKKASTAQVRAQVNDSIFAKRWEYKDSLITDNRPLFAIDGKEYNQHDFAQYLKNNQSIEVKRDYDEYIETRYNEYINSLVMQHADNQLEKENKEFAELIKEYRNGLMIFAYNDDHIWTKAIVDSAGFEAFYNEESKKKDINNPDDSNYFWDTRARTLIFNITDSVALPSTQAVKLIKKNIGKGLSHNNINAILEKKGAKKGLGKVTSEVGLYEMGHQTVLQRNEWRVGTYVHSKDKGYQVIVVQSVIDPQLKTRQEARGYYMTDYQNQLEEQLIKDLRKKYNVKIHQDVVDETTY